MEQAEPMGRSVQAVDPTLEALTPAFVSVN